MEIREPERLTPVVGEADVIVVGSGPGGLSAAIAAARAGVNVILIERFGCFGGNITSVGVEGFAWYRHEKTIEAGGLAFEYEQRAIESNAAVPESQSKSYELDSEGFKVVADNIVLKAGDTIFIKEGLKHWGISSTVPRICLSCEVQGHVPSYEVTYYFG